MQFFTRSAWFFTVCGTFYAGGGAVELINVGDSYVVVLWWALSLITLALGLACRRIATLVAELEQQMRRWDEETRR